MHQRSMLIIGVMPMPPPISTAGTFGSGSMKKWPAGAFTRRMSPTCTWSWKWLDDRPGVELGMIGRRRHALDRHPVVRGVGPVRQGVAAGDRARGRCAVRAARRDIQCEGEELARLERRQRLAVDWLQVERTLRLRRVLERTLSDAELAPTRPRRIGLDGLCGRRCRWALTAAERRRQTVQPIPAASCRSSAAEIKARRSMAVMDVGAGAAMLNDEHPPATDSGSPASWAP